MAAKPKPITNPHDKSCNLCSHFYICMTKNQLANMWIQGQITDEQYGERKRRLAMECPSFDLKVKDGI